MNRKEIISSSFEGYIKPIKRRNTMLDSFFYDVSSLTKEERQKLTDEINPEGSIIVMPPASSGQDYASYPIVTAFLKSKHKAVSRFIIAGVGSSDLGAAALARNVADFFGEDVGAIVAGYGVADLLTEGLGGWFSLGITNRLAYYLEEARAVLTTEDDLVLDTDVHPYVAGHPDSRTLLRLLISKNAKIDFILGHSKGCLSIANALNGYVSYGTKENIKKRAEEIRIVTTGAVVEFPDVFAKGVYQYLGGIDWFGGINSLLCLQFEPVIGAWHHTNSNLPFAMNIPDLLTNWTNTRRIAL